MYFLYFVETDQHLYPGKDRKIKSTESAQSTLLSALPHCVCAASLELSESINVSSKRSRKEHPALTAKTPELGSWLHPNAQRDRSSSPSLIFSQRRRKSKRGSTLRLTVALQIYDHNREYLSHKVVRPTRIQQG